MPRIRTLKPEFWQDEKLAPCTPITRLVFLGLICMADDAGRLLDNVKVIDAFIFPDTSETSRGSIGELSGMGRIRRGITASGQRIIEIVNWKTHQKIEKPNLRGALPPIIQEVQEPQALAEIPRHVGEASGKDRGSVGEASQNHTNDQRPTTNDRGPTTTAREADRPTGAIDPRDPEHWRRVVVAVNRGLTEQFGEQPVPVTVQHAGTQHALDGWAAAGVPIEFAEARLVEAGRTCRPGDGKAPRSLRYFADSITAAWQAERAHRERAIAPVDEGAPDDPTRDLAYHTAVAYARRGVAEWQDWCRARGVDWEVAA